MGELRIAVLGAGNIGGTLGRNLHGLKAHVNRAPAFSQLWRTLDHSRGEPIALEPIRPGSAQQYWLLK